MSLKNSNANVAMGSGFWHSAKPAVYSKETQELIRAMMQESKLTNFQQRQISDRLNRGDSLPSQCHPTSSRQPPPSAPTNQRRKVTLSLARPSLRPAERCRAGDAYSREKFQPRPTRDLNKEKHRLQNLMATGKDLPEPSRAPPQTQEPKEEEEDRFDELVAEIQERREFLEDMEALGRGKEYQNIIRTEISQKLREMEVIDKMRCAELRAELHRSEGESESSS
ncbi:UPF0193 protein EVG1 [Bombina bombina]|uniref:UPF0193 protein EVG1 n=1 Tax=Bombina bombina TaxID=8345 RepID=UPI00235AAB09|nr:UPF0193 protein EVG1 [Bombina bombina]